METTPALDPFQNISVTRAREALAAFGDGGSEALTAHARGESFTGTQGKNEAYAAGLLAHHAESLLAVVDALTADRPPLTELEVRAAEAAKKIAVEAIYNAGLKAGQESAS